MKRLRFKISMQKGSVPPDVVEEAVRYVMEKTNYKPRVVKFRIKKPSSRKVK